MKHSFVLTDKDLEKIVAYEVYTPFICGLSFNFSTKIVIALAWCRLVPKENLGWSPGFLFFVTWLVMNLDQLLASTTKQDTILSRKFQHRLTLCWNSRPQIG